MELIDSIIQINITREQIQTTSRIGFNTALLIGATPPILSNGEVFPNIKKYYSLTEVAEDFPGPTLNSPATVEYLMASKYFGQEISPESLSITIKTTQETYLQAYRRAYNGTGDFYAVMTTSNDENDIVNIAVEIESQNKIFGASSQDNDIKNDANGNIADQLRLAGYKRTFVTFHSLADAQKPEAALFGKMLPYEPGTATWDYKKLAGVTPDMFTTAEILNMDSNNINYYTTVAGSNVTINGKMVGGEYIDIIVGLDWLEQYIKVNLFTVFTDRAKVPINDQGIGLFENNLRASLREASERDVINDDYVITVPRASDISKADRAAGYLSYLSFTATLTGAFHSLKLNALIKL